MQTITEFHTWLTSPLALKFGDLFVYLLHVAHYKIYIGKAKARALNGLWNQQKTKTLIWEKKAFNYKIYIGKGIYIGKAKARASNGLWNQHKTKTLIWEKKAFNYKTNQKKNTSYVLKKRKSFQLRCSYKRQLTYN